MADIVHPGHPHAGQVKVASGLDVVAAVWLFISAFTVVAEASLAWSNAIVAIVICVLAAARAFGAYGQAWMSWLNALLGVWVLISPWLATEFATEAGIWNNVITGLIIIVLAAWSALATNSERPSEPVART